MTGLRGFGVTVDLATGRMRNWYSGADGIKRWADADQPVDPTPTEAQRAALDELAREGQARGEYDPTPTEAADREEH